MGGVNQLFEKSEVLQKRDGRQKCAEGWWAELWRAGRVLWKRGATDLHESVESCPGDTLF